MKRISILLVILFFSISSIQSQPFFAGNNAGKLLFPSNKAEDELKTNLPKLQTTECLDNGFESGVGSWNHQWVSNNPCFVLSPATPSPGVSPPGWFYNSTCAYVPPTTIQSQSTFIVENIARPGGGIKSLKVGGGNIYGNGGTGIEISKTFSIPVSGNNAYLSYWYKLTIPQGYDNGQTFVVTITGAGCGGGFFNSINLSPIAGSPINGAWINQIVSLCNLNGCSITIKFKVTGCSNYAHPVNVNVDDICLISESTPVITPVSPICIYGAPVSLVAIPSGGTFSGPGVSGNIFNPTTAGAGTHTITYSYLSPSGCVPISTTTTNIIVNASPTISFTPPSTYCTSSPIINFNTPSIISPAGGNFSGPGISGTLFNPSVAGPGIHTVSYIYTDPVTNCSSTASAIIVVNPLPTVSFTPPLSFCINTPASDFNVPGIVNPVGGNFTGTGISGSTFNPSLAGVGTHTITYLYTDANGCTASSNSMITVYVLPIVGCLKNLLTCIGAAPFALSGGIPAGGVYSGTGVSGGSFDPGAAGIGTHSITYTYTNANGCTNNCLFTITVNSLPVVSFTPPSTYCINSPIINFNSPSIISPAGGNFSGPGISGTIFNPSVAGPGNHTVSYIYTDPVTNCSSAASAIIVVNPLPTVSFTPPLSFCINTPTINLNVPGIANPVGGNFTGSGIIGNMFNPSLAGIGTHTISYSYISPTTGCIATATAVITVYPTVTETEYINLCPGETYTLPSGVIINSPGTYTSNVFTSNGCDRTVTTIAICCNCVGSSWGAVNYVTAAPVIATIPLQLTCNSSLKPFTYNIKCKIPITLNAIYNCVPSSCGLVKVVITPPSGPASTHTLPYVFTPTMSGVYSVSYLGYCGANLCKTCKLFFKVICPISHGTPKDKNQ